jgi:hypothetical protein
MNDRIGQALVKLFERPMCQSSFRDFLWDIYKVE